MTPGRRLVLVACGAILGAFGAATALADDWDQRARIGFAIAEQQGITLDRDRPAEGVGSYLVSSNSCNDCHTWPNFVAGGNPYARQPKQFNIANFLAGGRLFVLPSGGVCSANTTPAPGTHKAAGLSRADFIYLMRTGCDPQDSNFRDPAKCGLLQVMPWPQYQDMTQRDLSAVYSFLSALPHAEVGSAAQCSPNPQGVAAE
jgi:hypothetical protein